MSLPPLAARLEGLGPEPDPDELLLSFVDYAEEQGLSLYPAQEEAILELFSGRHVVLGTPTGSGKSLVALALHFKALAEGRVSFYTAPVKALVNEKFFALCEALGPERVGLMTGDATVNREAPVICCTAEVLANLALRGETGVDYAVLDEFHFYGDRDRGAAWQLPLVVLKDTTFLLMSATLGNVAPITERLTAFTGRQVADVSGGERPVPLEFEYRETPLHETVADLLDRGEAPIYLVSFTQREAAEQAQSLMSVDFCTKEHKRDIAEMLAKVPFDTPHGKDLSRFLRHGIGLHHAGLLPRYRRVVERLAQQGLLRVVSGTDTLGVGVNIPIRTVLLRRLCKYDGEKTRVLQVRELLQIAGRAGRRGFDDHGWVVCQAPDHIVENRRLDEKAARRPDLKKKIVKQKPPTRGYAHWDGETFERLRTSPPEELVPVFEVTHGMLLEVLQGHASVRDGGYRWLLDLVERTHLSDHDRREQRRLAARRMRSLRTAEIVRVERTPEGGRLAVDAELGEDFSLDHTLGLWLLHALEQLDPNREDYALVVTSLTEAILEDPRAVLYRQVDVLKGELVARLKAEGVEYEERMEKLAEVEHPKPEADFIYRTFGEFARTHPWLDEGSLKPKSIAREMFERMSTFNDYVRHYGLQRSEGVLLRHLSSVWRALTQAVPEPFHDEGLADVVTYLRALIRGVDASLLEEWESMHSGETVASAPESEAPAPSRPADPAADPKAFAARVRNELHRLLRCLADGNFEGALALLWPGDVEWTAESLGAAFAPWFEAHGGLDLTPAARQSRNTHLREDGPRQWAIQQTLVGADGDDDGALVGRIDLSSGRDPEAPLVELLAVEG